MSIELGLSPARVSAQPRYWLEETVICIGAVTSMCLLILTVFEYAGVVHTKITWFVVDQMVNGEARFNPNGDIHGDWGNQTFAVLTAPTFIGYFSAACVTLVRKLFTKATD